MAYRKAKGLCYKCGLKWGPTHTCSTTVPLHLVEELWQMFDMPQVVEDHFSHPGEAHGNLMVLSVNAVLGTEAPQSIKLAATMFAKSVIMLVDSGSSSSFISEQLAWSGSPRVPLQHPVQVQVANGQVIQCTHQVVDCKVYVGGYCFKMDLKILPLNCYDVILGMDWLASNSPMHIDWQEKWLVFYKEQTKVVLQGLRSDLCSLDPVSVPHLVHLASLDELWCIIQLQTVKKLPEDNLPAEIQQLIQEYASLFDKPTGLPPARSHQHTIPLVTGAVPFRLRPYRYNPAQKDEIEKQISELLQNGMIQPSSSPFASPIILARKKTGDWRLCVDYRRLNALTVKNKYPLPVIDELLDELQGAVWFSSLDLSAGYHQIQMDPKDIPKTAFQTHHGHFEYRVMPYGLTSGPATFQLTMNSVLAPFLRKCVVVFIDDILIYSATWPDHLCHLRAVFDTLRNQQLKVKLSKCSFAQIKLQYLGHVISKDGVATDPSKIEAVQSWPSPKTAKEVRSFLGLAGYYRKFVKNFGIMSRPLTNLLKKGQVFTWHETQESAFQALKQALITAPVLALPDFSKKFEVETDACDTGIGAVLHQAGHPIAFVSKSLGPRHQGLSTYEKECLAILLAVDHWRSYLMSGEFIIRTDQRSLVHLDDQRLTTPWQQKALTKLLGLQYQICYKKGQENRVADALSRLPTGQVLSLSTLKNTWLQSVSESYAQYDDTTPILQSLAVQSPNGNYKLKEGLILYKDRILLAAASEWPLKIFQSLHNTPIGGHSGFLVTYQKIKKLFMWIGMKKMIQQWCQNCPICQQAKSERVPYPGLLQPLPVPEGAWQLVSMDFIEGLPLSDHSNCIMVVVDKFSKYAHFIPLHHPFTALAVAHQFMDNVFKLHGFPQALITDRDRIFTSALWQELFKLAGVEL
jgi:hypothetical protein